MERAGEVAAAAFTTARAFGDGTLLRAAAALMFFGSAETEVTGRPPFAHPGK
jgi:hypothetical protein